MTTGERICKYRKLNGLTQEELAAKLGTTSQNIYKYENNIVNNIPLRNIEKMANIFGISPNELVGWTPQAQIETLKVEIADLEKALQAEPEGESREDLAEALDAKTEELEDLEFMYHMRAMTRPKSAPAASLTEDEARLIEWWRTLPEEKKKAILTLSEYS